ncbi:hypothetical protein V7128_21180 [Neobacillus vireti]|uniref:hypothetical protein n=1 Tax=Neobacillus vireti TaxID=220686 RepID=UPI002FFE1F2C
MEYSRLIFIGEIIGSQEIRIRRKPSIYDAFLLSKRSPLSDFPSSMSRPYQSIPLEEEFKILIHMSNHYRILLSYRNHSLHLAESSKALTEEEVLEVFTNFIVMTGGSVIALGTSPFCKTRSRKRKKERIHAIEKKLESNSR